MLRSVGARVLPFLFALSPVQALAVSTLNQFQSVTVQPRTPPSQQRPAVRHAVYGDSIFAGYVAGGGWFGLPGQTQRNAAYVESEALAEKWGVNIDHQGRCVSGATASQIYSRLQSDVSYMRAPNVRMISFEMCGNDYLRARDTFRNAAGCDGTPIGDALATCRQHLALAMDFINANAPAGALKMVMTIYYPGFDADRRVSKAACGGRSNAEIFIDYLAAGNWTTCDLARQKGFHCGDSFADFMAADFDWNGDGQIDSVALRYVPGESETTYVTRIARILRDTLNDANRKRLSEDTSVDYIQKDDVHPTFSSEAFSPADFWGHNRAGASLSRHNASF
ncbi:MAG: SGNH/GDSL hydrolase family protein [Myxococcaceae bacterium]